MFKILHLDECPTSPMEPGRGEQIKLVNPSLGTEKLDVHLNRLIPGGPRGKLHHHTKADNVYIVKRGEGTLTVDGKTYVIRENDVVYIPAGRSIRWPIWATPSSRYSKSTRRPASISISWWTSERPRRGHASGRARMITSGS